MEQNKEQKWIVHKYGQDTRCITDTDGNDILSWMDVGEEQAERNARLCASAPQMKELLNDMYLWMSEYIKTSGQHNRNGINYLINEYEKLCKKEQ